MGDKTEAPTPRKLEDSRKEGQVARSLELNSAAILLIGSMLLRSTGAALVGKLQTLTVQSINSIQSVTITDTWLRSMVFSNLLLIVPTLGLILVGLLATGVIVTLGQTGFMWTSKKVGFDFKRVNPMSGLQRIFSKKGLVELGKSLLKLGVVGYVAYSFVRGHMNELAGLGQTYLATGLSRWVELAGSLALQVGVAYMVLAVADYAYQRWQYMQTLKMTKDEVKEDMKRSEGDPFLRGRIRAQQRKIARTRMMANVHKASVVVTNPTHFAVAIQYNPNMAAPRVVAKGAYLVAQRIVEIARDCGIPVVQNVLLARTLYRIVAIEQEIPPDLYRTVAEVLAYVYRLRGRVLNPAEG